MALRSPQIAPDRSAGEAPVSRQDAQPTPQGPVLTCPPNGAPSGLSRKEWLARYESWIQKIDMALRAYGASALRGDTHLEDTRGKAQEPSWLVDSIIIEEKIRW